MTTAWVRLQTYEREFILITTIIIISAITFSVESSIKTWGWRLVGENSSSARKSVISTG